MNCPQCQTELSETTILGRKRQKCSKCTYLQYEKTETARGFSVIEDDILEDISKDGRHRVIASVLINTMFRGEPTKSSNDKIQEWAKAHELSVRTEDGKDARGKPCRFVVFSRTG